MLGPPPRSTLFPYTTLFRSIRLLASLLPLCKGPWIYATPPALVTSTLPRVTPFLPVTCPVPHSDSSPSPCNSESGRMTACRTPQIPSPPRNLPLCRQIQRLVSAPARYQAQTKRHYPTTVEEFDRLKALRGNIPNEPNSVQIGRAHV